MNFILALLALAVSEGKTNTRYEQATKTTKEAVLIQTGVKAQLDQAGRVTKDKIYKWSDDNGVKFLAVGIVGAATLAYTREIRWHVTNQVTLRAQQKGATAIWTVKF